MAHSTAVSSGACVLSAHTNCLPRLVSAGAPAGSGATLTFSESVVSPDVTVVEVVMEKAPCTDQACHYPRSGAPVSVGDLVAPAEGRLVAQHPPGLVDRHQRLALAECLAHRHARKHLGCEVSRRARHDRIGVGDHENVAAGGLVEQGLANRLRAIASIDVGPQIP